MGVEQTATFAAGAVLPWPALMERMAGRGIPMQLRMIDGLPAFPDEEPPAEWRELRAGTAAGMVTLRRTPAGASVVVWGNADPAVVTAAHALLWAVADVTGGRVETPAGCLSAAEFARSVGLPEVAD